MSPPPETRAAPDEDPPASAWLSRIAFGGALVVVIARAMMPQYLRDTEQLAPLPDPANLPPRAAGPAVGVVLDALTMLLALLVLARLAIDRQARPLRTWTALLLAILAAWAFASTLWASDKFAAAASASTWLAAAGLVLIFSQTVRTWSRLRVVAGVAAGLFLVNIGHGAIYRLVELEDLRQEFERNEMQILAQQGLEPGTFAAENFKSRLMQGQTGGFSASPNSLAATLVVLGFVTVGLIWQRVRDRSEPMWGLVLSLAFLPGAWILWKTGSRTAIAAALLVAIVLAALFPLRHVLAERRRSVFAAFVLLVALGAAGVIGIGLATGTLPHPSLAFRWHYWTGAWGVFTDHPLLGAGFANFGDAYLAHRPAIAAEEVKDPHNMLVRFASETGIIGATLAVAWLLTFAWEQARPAARPDDRERPGLPRPLGLGALGGVVALGVLLNIAASIDLAADPGFVFLEVFRRGLYGLLIMGGLLLGTMRSAHDPVADTTPAPALAAAMIAGLAAALLHAMVDVVVFEIPVLMLVAMLMGASLAIRATDAMSSPRPLAWGTLLLASAGTVAFVALYAFPTVVAERFGGEGDRLLRTSRPVPAAQQYARALEWSPVSNSSYHEHLARAMAYGGAPPAQIEASLLRAVEANPRSIADRVSLAEIYAAHFQPPRLADAAAQYETILALNPNDLQLRLDYARVLAGMNRPADAAAQLRTALDFNDQLHPNEPERLPPQRVEAIRGMISNLEGAAASEAR